METGDGDDHDDNLRHGQAYIPRVHSFISQLKYCILIIDSVVNSVDSVDSVDFLPCRSILLHVRSNFVAPWSVFRAARQSTVNTTSQVVLISRPQTF